MKTGMSFAEFMNVAARAEELKRDYEVETKHIHAVMVQGSGLGLHLERQNQTYRIGSVAHDNLATLTGIPRQYYGRMLERHPKELAELIEMHLHQDDVPGDRFIRTIGTKVRALLSTRYGVLDHIDVARMLGNVLASGEGQIQSVLCTERRLTFQYLFPRFQGIINPKVGDVVQAGLAITNSEVGLGMYRVELLAFILACLNGMIKPGRGEWKLERIHRGTPDVRALTDYTQDRVVALPGEFAKTIKLIQGADGVYIPEEDLPKVVEKVRASQGLTLPEAEGTLSSLYQEGRWTGWGLVNAINYQAHAHQDVDRSVELERISGQVLESYY